MDGQCRVPHPWDWPNRMGQQCINYGSEIIINITQRVLFGLGTRPLEVKLCESSLAVFYVKTGYHRMCFSIPL